MNLDNPYMLPLAMFGGSMLSQSNQPVGFGQAFGNAINAGMQGMVQQQGMEEHDQEQQIRRLALMQQMAEIQRAQAKEARHQAGVEKFAASLPEGPQREAYLADPEMFGPQVAQALFPQQKDWQNPEYQAWELQKIAAGRSPPAAKDRRTQVVDGVLIDLDTGATIKELPQRAGAGPFEGNALDAQALNKLVADGKITAQQAAEYAAGKFATGPNGELNFALPSSVFPAVPPSGGAPAQPPGSPGLINVRPATPPPPTLDQTQAAGYRDRLQAADQVLEDPKAQAAATSLTQEALDRVPFIDNWLKSSDRQRAEQAQRDFINAQLRRESGAAIGTSEFETGGKQYFPQFGDSPEVLKQKSEARQQAIANMQRASGPVPEPPKQANQPQAMTQPPVALQGNTEAERAAEYARLPSGAAYWFVKPDGTRVPMVKP